MLPFRGDAHIAAGRTQLVTSDNLFIKTLDKSGNVLFSQTIDGPGGFWEEPGLGVPGPTNVQDTEVHYDISTGRFWIVAMPAVFSNQYFPSFFVAYSLNPNDGTSWKKFRLQVPIMPGFDPPNLSFFFIDSVNIAIDTQDVWLSGL